jgi:hypothetical protein
MVGQGGGEAQGVADTSPSQKTKQKYKKHVLQTLQDNLSQLINGGYFV